MNSPIASRSPGILKASSRQVGLSGKPGTNTSRNSNPDAGFSTVHKHSGTYSNWIPRISRKSGNSRRFRRFGTRKSNHFRMSPTNADHMEKVFSIICMICDRKPTDDLTDLDVNTATFCVFVSVTLQAAVHFGQDHSQNLRCIKNRPLKSVKQLFRTTEKLIKYQVEITGLSTIDWNQSLWRESSLLCDGAVHIMNPQTYLFADSVLCLGGISTTSPILERQN